MLGSDFEPYTKTLNNARVVFGATVAIGKDNFESIMGDRLTFVDKSMLIKEFIESSDFISLILRPRRFGKSTNLSMLNRFFKVPRSHEEEIICRQLFEKLKISAEIEIMQKHFAHLSPYQQKRFQRILDSYLTYPVSELKIALQELSIYLRQHYKKKCIVLIDEYDSPMECAYNKGYYGVANDFFKGMFSSLLKSNDENIAKAMLVGVLRIAKSGFLSGLNNLMVYPLHQESRFHLYADKFGFTPDEVELLLPMRKDLKTNDVQKWYDGYISGENVHLYNPWSIVCFLSRGTLNTYWVDTGSTQTLKKCLWKASTSFKETVEKLLKGEYIASIEIQDDLQYLYLDQYQDSAIWTLLYYAGYLTMNSEKHLVIPNIEIRLEWHKWVINVPFFTRGQTVTSMLDNLLLGNLDLFRKEFEYIVIDALSFYDVGESQSGKNAENVYHAFCLGMFVVARDRGYIVHSNREAGMGRYDVKIVPKSGVGEMAIIIEFKIVHDNKSLNNVAHEGLCQIEKKQYRAGLQDEVKRLLEIGIAFEGKKACVVGHLLHRTEDREWIKSL
ncbi:11714_t:CDS:2 [Cetraspora pellucida]|uniref:11714_t:CDS:1 n=1 Tax=Cetraspora pellucida TaxID=1433469 RepID=A0ACA9KJE0_9GLOM|nr:11714_t:CDS:2 [Cetraspora pellucida]